MADPVPLRFRATLAENVAPPDPWLRNKGKPKSLAADEIVRKDGARGPRALTLIYFDPDEDHPTGELSIEELHPDGRRSTMMKRRRVDRPDIAAAENELFRLAPKGQGSSLHERLNWPAIECVLKPEDLARVAEPLPLFGLRIQVVSAEDEHTRAWMQSKKLPGGKVPLPRAAVTAAATSKLGAIAAAATGGASSSSLHSVPVVDENLSFFLGGPRE